MSTSQMLLVGGLVGKMKGKCINFPLKNLLPGWSVYELLSRLLFISTFIRLHLDISEEVLSNLNSRLLE